MNSWKSCVRCGRKYSNIRLFQDTDGLCPDCRGDDLAAAQLEDGKTEFVGEDEVRCPWCGRRVHHESEGLLLTDGGEEDCPHCGKRYTVTAWCRWMYDTERVEA